MEFVKPREEHTYLSMKDTSILSTEEEEMAAFFGYVQKQKMQGSMTIKENEIISGRSDEHKHPQNDVVSTVSHAFGHVLHE